MECPKSLWMDKNMPKKKVGQDDSRMIIGNMIGDLAMGYFSVFAEVPFNRENMGDGYSIKGVPPLFAETTRSRVIIS